jgi:hypothetical protein
MFCRHIPFKPGDQATTINPISSFSLPEGLAEGVTVTIVSQDCDYWVKDSAGKEWRVPYQGIKHRMEYQLKPGLWVHESDPRLIPHFAKWKAEREAREAREKEELSSGVRYIG